MTNGPETEVQAPGPVAFTRESYFRASVWTMLVVLLFLSPTFLVVFGWFLNGYQEATDAAAVSHRLHEVVFGMFFALALVGAISLLLRPERSTAGLFQMAITLLTLFAIANLTVPWQFGLLLQLIPLAAVIYFRPRGIPLRSGPVWGWAIVLVLAALLPFLTEVAALLARALDEAQNHTTHWSAMAAFSLALLGMGLVVAFRITGYRVTGFSIAGAAIGYGVVSLIFPFDASSHRFGYSVGLILWGLAWLGILRFADNPSPAPSRSTVIPLVKWVLIVPVLFVVSAIWLANDDQPNVPHRPDPNHPELLASDVDAQTCLDCHATRIAGAPQPPP